MSDTAHGSWAGSRFGPTLAAYGLFPDVVSPKDAFNGFTGTVAIVSCPGGKASRGTWWHNSNPSDILGQIACGTYKDTQPQVMWTNEDNLVFALVAGSPQGPTLD
jgi:serine/threonine kinase PknH